MNPPRYSFPRLAGWLCLAAFLSSCASGPTNPQGLTREEVKAEARRAMAAGELDPLRDEWIELYGSPLPRGGD